jgi:ribosomal protein L37AE/L43A
MERQPPDAKAKKQWESVHRCPQCGYALNLDEIDLKAITTGIVSCPSCDRSGPIDIQIIEREKAAE